MLGQIYQFYLSRGEKPARQLSNTILGIIITLGYLQGVKTLGYLQGVIILGYLQGVIILDYLQGGIILGFR